MDNVILTLLLFVFLPLPFLLPSKDSPECIQTDMDLCYAGSIEIAGEATLEDLKMQVRCSPVLEMYSNTVIN